MSAPVSHAKLLRNAAAHAKIGAEMAEERGDGFDEVFHLERHEAFSAGAAALDEVATLRANEGEQLRSLSDALSGGNAATWDEVSDAAATLRAERDTLQAENAELRRAIDRQTLRTAHANITGCANGFD
jgi:hypothetical protein